jgi:hypothetical protein
MTGDPAADARRSMTERVCADTSLDADPAAPPGRD